MPEYSKSVAGNNIITKPSHYIEGRNIETITVIEQYGLCHHLACVVKYVSRAGRKTSLINDLKKADWYLDRELGLRQQGIGSCLSALKSKPYHTIPEILDDWELSANLSACLSYILDSCLLKDDLKSFLWFSRISSNQELSSTTHNVDFLEKAMGFLKSAITCASSGEYL